MQMYTYIYIYIYTYWTLLEECGDLACTFVAEVLRRTAEIAISQCQVTNRYCRMLRRFVETMNPRKTVQQKSIHDLARENSQPTVCRGFLRKGRLTQDRLLQMLLNVLFKCFSSSGAGGQVTVQTVQTYPSFVLFDAARLSLLRLSQHEISVRPKITNYCLCTMFCWAPHNYFEGHKGSYGLGMTKAAKTEIWSNGPDSQASDF